MKYAILGFALMFLLAGCSETMPTLVPEEGCHIQAATYADGLEPPRQVKVGDLPTYNGEICNVIPGTESSLIVPVPFERGTFLRAVASEDSVDWLFWEDATGTLLLQPAGKTDIIEIASIPVDNGLREIRDAWALWVEDVLHVVTTSDVDDPGNLQSDVFHWWWDQSNGAVEQIEPAPMGTIREIAGVGQVNGDFYVAGTDMPLTDILGFTNEANGLIWQTEDTHALGAPGTLVGHWIKDVASAPHALHICTSKQGSTYHSTSRNWEFTLVNSAERASTECRVAAGVSPTVLTFALPAIGASGDGLPGSSDGEDMVIHRQDNGSWDATPIFRQPTWAAELLQVGSSIYLLDSAEGQSAAAQLLDVTQRDASLLWENTRPASLVWSPSELIIAAEGIHDDEWDYPAPAALGFGQR